MMKQTSSTAQRLADLPYEQRICRIEHYPACLERVRSGTSDHAPEYGAAADTMEQEIAAVAAAGTQVWSVTSQADRGTPLWPSKILPPPPELDTTVMPRFLDLAHQQGMLILGYYPFIFTKPLLKIHPEWAIQMLDDGPPEVWNEGWFCWNSPYRDWLPEYLNELFDCLDFDGIYFDDMNWGSHSDTGQRRTGGCCCAYCQALYREETGRELPRKVDMASVDFRRFVSWRYEKFTAAMRHVASKIKARHPDKILDFNYYGRPYGDNDIGWKTAHPLNPLNDIGMHLFMEAGLDNLGSSFPAKLLQAHGTSFGFWLWATQILPEANAAYAPYPEVFSPTIYGLTAVAHGGASLTTCLEGGSDTIHGETLKHVFSEVKRLSQYVGKDSVKYVALHVSQQTKDFGYGDTPADYWQLLRGTHEILSRSHLLTDYIFDQRLTYEHLAPYQVLFLSNSMCLSVQQAAAIRRFVAEGGTLIATHESSLYDELGQRQENFQLADVLGVNYQLPTAPPPEKAPAVSADEITFQKYFYGREINYDESIVYLPQQQALRATLGDVIAYAARQSYVTRDDQDQGNGHLEVLCTQSSLKWGAKHSLNQFKPDKPYDSGLPAVTSHTFGKGRAIYISGDVGTGYERNPLPQLKRFVAQVVSTTKPPIEVDAPKVIEVTATWRSPSEIAIHLLNNPTPFIPWSTPRWDRRSHFYVDEIIPIYDIVLKLNGFKARRASLPFQGKELEISGIPTTIRVPMVGLHEVVLVKLAGTS